MRRRWQWRILGVAAGALIGIGVVAFGTYGSAGESESERHAEQSIFWVRLYDERGSPEAVSAVEREWEARLYAAGAVLGGVAGLAIALRLTRQRT